MIYLTYILINIDHLSQNKCQNHHIIFTWYTCNIFYLLGRKKYEYIINPLAPRVTIWLHYTCGIQMPLFDIYKVIFYINTINTYINCLLFEWTQIIIILNFAVLILFGIPIYNYLYTVDEKYKFTFGINSIYILYLLFVCNIFINV